MKTTPLGKLATITTGGTPDRARPEFWGGITPWVKTTQVQNRLIERHHIDETISALGLKKLGSRIIPRGAVLVALIGQGKTRGQVALLGVDAAINQNCAAIVPTDKLDPRFLFQQLLSRYQEQVEALKTQKRALMQKLLSGEWRMPKAAPPRENSALNRPLALVPYT